MAAPDLIDALLSLSPNAEISYTNGVITWLNPTKPTHSLEDIEVELKRLTKVYTDTEYQRLRAVEYPPVTDYLDGVVKGDQAQIDKYIADCLAVKAKYPKPADV